MSNHYNVLMPREYTTKDGATKTAFTKIGVAFPMKNREGFQVTLEAVPMPSLKDGKLECKLLLMPPVEDNAERPAKAERKNSNEAALDSDAVPF